MSFKLYVVTGQDETARNMYCSTVYKRDKVRIAGNENILPEILFSHPLDQIAWVYDLKILDHTYIETNSPFILAALNTRMLAHDVGYCNPAYEEAGAIKFEDVIAVECFRTEPGGELRIVDIKNDDTRLIGVNDTDKASDILEEHFNELLERVTFK